jgi:hypothetical protein
LGSAFVEPKDSILDQASVILMNVTLRLSMFCDLDMLVLL